MNRNQKIAAGCGGAGCLGLIVVVVVGAVIYLAWPSDLTANRNSNISINSNRSSNSNSTTDSVDETSPSISDDDKHKLFQAAGTTRDSELIQRVLKKIGLMKADGTTTEENERFAKDHFSWALKNLQFINSVNTPEKARAYVEAHIDD